MPPVNVPVWLEQHKVSGPQILVLALCTAAVALDSFDTQAIGYVAPAVIEALRVPPSQFTPVFVSGLAGLLAGGLFMAPLADRIGRKRVMVWSAALCGIFSLATALATSLELFVVLRFLTGLALGGSLPNAIALTAEYFPTRNRAAVTMAMFTGFPVGATLGGFFAADLLVSNGWPSVFVAGGVLPLALAIILAVALPESVRHLALRGESERVKAILERMSSQASFPNVTDFVVEEERGSSPGLRHLFREGRALGTALLWTMLFTSLLDIYFLTSWLPQVLGDAGLSLSSSVVATTLLQGGGAIAALSTGWLIDRFGFPAVLLPLNIGAALWIAILGFAGRSAPLVMTASFLAGACVIGGQTAMNVLAAVFYPTSIRATGLGWALGIGRLGSIVGPIIGGLFLSWQWSRPWLFLAAAVPAIVAAGAIIVMARIKRDELTAAAMAPASFRDWG